MSYMFPSVYKLTELKFQLILTRFYTKNQISTIPHKHILVDKNTDKKYDAYLTYTQNETYSYAMHLLRLRALLHV